MPRPPICEIQPFFHLQLRVDRPDIFNPLAPKWLGAGCQSWCHIIHRWSQSDAPAPFLPSYGLFDVLDLCTNLKKKKLFFVSAVAEFLLRKHQELSQRDSGTVQQALFLEPLSPMTDTVFPSPAENIQTRVSVSPDYKSGLEVDSEPFKSSLPTNHNVFSPTTSKSRTLLQLHTRVCRPQFKQSHSGSRCEFWELTND